ncbi:MAG: hypothetical protein GY953_39415 [bacterium]|nr:hypothetical protein [bacterium]
MTTQPYWLPIDEAQRDGTKIIGLFEFWADGEMKVAVWLTYWMPEMGTWYYPSGWDEYECFWFMPYKHPEEK